MRIKKLTTALFIYAVAASSFAQITAAMKSSVTVTAACDVSMNDFVFGETNFVSDKLLMGKLKLKCNPGVVATISLSGGNSADPSARYMVNEEDTTQKLGYKIHLTGEDNSIGDGSQGTSVFTIIGNGGLQEQSISGTVMKGQYLTPGIYRDRITFTVNY